MFFPAYNEAANIAKVVHKARTALDQVASDYELIIVNDGSTDATGQIADELARQDEHIRVCHHERNKGYGAALKTGYNAARYEFIFFLDGDDQFDSAEIINFLPYIHEYDIVTGYRLVRQDSFFRNLNARGWNLINFVLFGTRVKDINCAFKCINRRVFELFSLTSDGAMINAELYAQARRHGLKIKEVGVSHYPRTAGVQTGAKLSVILRAFKELFTLRKQLDSGK